MTRIVYIGWGLPYEMPSIPEAIVPRFLAKLGHEVTAVILGDGPSDLDGVYLLRYRTDRPSILPDGEIYIVNHRENPICDLALRHARWIEAPSIYIAHDPFFTPLGDRKHIIDHMVVLSEYERERRMLEIPADRITRIANGLDYPLYHLEQGCVREHDLLYVGQCASWKGIFDLVEAMRRLPERHLTILCHTNTEEPKLRRAVAGLFNITIDVRRPGKRPFTEVVRAYRSHRTLIVPSHTDCYPTVLLEGMHCGMRVIASAVGGIPEIVGKRGALVKPRAVDELVEAIRHDDDLPPVMDVSYDRSALRQALEFDNLICKLIAERPYAR